MHQRIRRHLDSRVEHQAVRPDVEGGWCVQRRLNQQAAGVREPHLSARCARGPLNLMKPMIIMPTRRRASLLAKVFALLAMTGLANAAFPQSHLLPPAGDG